MEINKIHQQQNKTFFNVLAREMPLQFLGKSAGEYLVCKNSWYKKAMHASITIILMQPKHYTCVCVGYGVGLSGVKKPMNFPSRQQCCDLQKACLIP